MSRAMRITLTVEMGSVRKGGVFTKGGKDAKWKLAGYARTYKRADECMERMKVWMSRLARYQRALSEVPVYMREALKGGGHGR